MDDCRIFVDNEKNTRTNQINAMSITSLKCKLGIIYYGPYVDENKHYIYKHLEVSETVCYCWDNNLEKEYPNFYDLQRLHWE